MNILLTMKNLSHSNGGVCTHVIDLAREYSAMGHRVVIMAEDNEYHGQTDSIPGLTVIETPFRSITGGGRAFFDCCRRVRQVCKEYQIDVIHSHSQRLLPICWLVKRMTGIPFVWTNHINWYSIPKQLKWMLRLFRNPVISVSDELKQDMIDLFGVPEKRLFVVNNGIDPSMYLPLEESEKEEIRTEFHVDPEEFVICEVARLAPVKGQDLLVRAVGRCQQEGLTKRPIHLLLAGDGDQKWFRENVLAPAEQLGVRCSAVGYQPPRKMFGIAQLSVLPSFKEGFPLAVVEAFAMRCPVLRTKTPGYSSVKNDVLLIEIGDEDALAERIAYAVNHFDELAPMVDRAYDDVTEKFSTAVMAEKTIEVYRAMLR